jgi:hypothetical protein
MMPSRLPGLPVAPGLPSRPVAPWPFRQLVTVTDGGWPFQLAISDETFAPELKSTRSHCGPDHVCTE